MRQNSKGVLIYEQDIEIPTYDAGMPDPNPMFLEKRVYQGSSGVVYPHPVIDSVSDERRPRRYTGVFLENEYIKVLVLPELGGRIQMAYDKRRDYHFVYHNQVIKPALVGLTGPWISGGIEFNWPQHHRPSTYLPVQYRIEEHEDGSRTLWTGEIERMFRTRGIAGFTLHPDRSYIEIRGKLYNGTLLPQTFLWWANPAVAVNDQYQSVFPPDVHAVLDHGKRDVSRFPIARGTYYKTDYSAGVDISWYRNIPVPTSYMAHRSRHDFVGGYDHGRNAGVLHVADHNVSPGKKMWTWGTSDFGRAWERNLTDQDGPYIELMTGVYTDNQPDFAYLMPGEQKEFTQYFIPYGDMPHVSCATPELILSVQGTDTEGIVRLHATASQDIDVQVETREGTPVAETPLTLGVGDTGELRFALPGGTDIRSCRVHVRSGSGESLLTYTVAEDAEEAERDIPDPATAPAAPRDVPSTDELYRIGMHLEQYRHATWDPEPYYFEGLRRDPGDYQCNTALGRRRLRAGAPAEAAIYLERAVERAVARNPNPYEGEALYFLGVARFLMGDLDAAYDRFYKATWNLAWKAVGFRCLARIEARRNRYDRALAFARDALTHNRLDSDAAVLYATLLRHQGRAGEAEPILAEAFRHAPLCFHAAVEQVLNRWSTVPREDPEMWTTLWVDSLRRNAYTAMEVILTYAAGGFFCDALRVTRLVSASLLEEDYDQLVSSPEGEGSDIRFRTASVSRGALPLLYYMLGYYEKKLGDAAAARESIRRAEETSHRYCFPNQIELIPVLQDAMEAEPTLSRAPCYLGCLLYDRRRYEEAHRYWVQAAGNDPSFSLPRRNLALSYYNKRGDAPGAIREMTNAFQLDPRDPRLLMELDLLHRKTGTPAEARLERLEAYPALVTKRDDLYLEQITLLNILGRHRKAYDLIAARQFHPWEGGEGKVPGQYRIALIGMAKEDLLARRFGDAESSLQNALVYPPNLGEGKLPFTADNEIHYWRGRIAEEVGDECARQDAFTAALAGESNPALSFYYNDTPADALFYRGLALRSLGRENEARSVFHTLRDYGEDHENDTVTIDYFAVSLPDLLVFEEDLEVKNRVFCRYLRGLGLLGLQDRAGAERSFSSALELDPAHAEAAIHKRMLEEPGLLQGAVPR